MKVQSKPVNVTISVVTPIVAEFESQEEYEDVLSLYADESDMLSDIGQPKILEAYSLYEEADILEMEWPEIDEITNKQSEYFY